MRYKKYEPISKQTRTEFKVWLVRNNLTQSDFARLCGVKRQYISQIVNGKVRITDSIIKMFKKNGFPLRHSK